jgi:hypothetical protein
VSRYRGNNETCDRCGIRYKDFRTGLDYKTIYEWLWSSSEDSSEWKYKRRGTVLGRWHMEKQNLWKQHLHECEGELSGESSETPLQELRVLSGG